jgi:hypothetical protein
MHNKYKHETCMATRLRNTNHEFHSFRIGIAAAFFSHDINTMKISSRSSRSCTYGLRKKWLNNRSKPESAPRQLRPFHADESCRAFKSRRSSRPLVPCSPQHQAHIQAVLDSTVAMHEKSCSEPPSCWRLLARAEPGGGQTAERQRCRCHVQCHVEALLV